MGRHRLAGLDRHEGAREAELHARNQPVRPRHRGDARVFAARAGAGPETRLLSARPFAHAVLFHAGERVSVRAGVPRRRAELEERHEVDQAVRRSSCTQIRQRY